MGQPSAIIFQTLLPKLTPCCVPFCEVWSYLEDKKTFVIIRDNLREILNNVKGGSVDNVVHCVTLACANNNSKMNYDENSFDT